ncbi:ester cyclase [Novosphingobium sp.]|uniref:ester cyclase n=1 Tax=Novosphingobium sp. TaxID=1874826 RepID=UPI001D1D0AC3|nr:ester cyclase [Novosphingobium sp.]MBX9664971.1 ester cyclase [Novosphingobium sp.]
MTTHPLVSSFYDRVWNSGDRAALDDLVTNDFRFQGSLGAPIVGRDAFWQIVTMVRTALSGYHCAIEACVSEEDQAFARMTFSGTHTGPFRGFAPSGRQVSWAGAALFGFEGGRIGEIWVLSDTAALDAILAANAEAESAGRP